eukprot:c5053_g1_i1.p1 GENE.c5053_g1_i1~~c5053_g1_i1.p1  ORF type:complete len:693 (+),score=154.84 c5053_g1_i1:306-2081(+)
MQDFVYRLSSETVDNDFEVVVVGDLHGSLSDLISILDHMGQPPSARKQLIFNGDFIDRGLHGTEVLLILIALKLCYPRFVHLLRGNHESEDMVKAYGFAREFRKKYSAVLMKMVVHNVFHQLPVALVLDRKIFVCHGGIPNNPARPFGVGTIADICSINHRMEPPQRGILTDCLWSDPHPLAVRRGRNSTQSNSYLNTPGPYDFEDDDSENISVIREAPPVTIDRYSVEDEEGVDEGDANPNSERDSVDLDVGEMAIRSTPPTSATDRLEEEDLEPSSARANSEIESEFDDNCSEFPTIEIEDRRPEVSRADSVDSSDIFDPTASCPNLQTYPTLSSIPEGVDDPSLSEPELSTRPRSSTETSNGTLPLTTTPPKTAPPPHSSLSTATLRATFSAFSNSPLSVSNSSLSSASGVSNKDTSQRGEESEEANSMTLNKFTSKIHRFIVKSSQLVTSLMSSPPQATSAGPVVVVVAQVGEGSYFCSNVARGAGQFFGEEALNRFLESEGLVLLVRSHQGPDIRADVNLGFALDMNEKCVTVFSATNYCGRRNKGAIAVFRNGSVAPELVNYRFYDKFMYRESSWWNKKQRKRTK